MSFIPASIPSFFQDRMKTTGSKYGKTLKSAKPEPFLYGGGFHMSKSRTQNDRVQQTSKTGIMSVDLEGLVTPAMQTVARILLTS
jgi:hypothetical protein